MKLKKTIDIAEDKVDTNDRNVTKKELLNKKMIFLTILQMKLN